MDKKELDEMKTLILDYVFPVPDYGFIETTRKRLRTKGLEELALKCFGACQVFAMDLINKEFEKRKEE